MNKVLIIVVIAIIVIGGGTFLLSKSNSSHQSEMNMQNTPSQMQTQTNPTSGSTQTIGKNTVTIQNFAFSPTTLTIKVGDKVTWTNQDSVGHSATADDNSFDTGVLQQGQSGSVTFNKPGTYSYHCSVHPMMKGTIIVK